MTDITKIETEDKEKQYQNFIQTRSLTGGGCPHGYLRNPRTCTSCKRDWENMHSEEETP